ncbi:hypothetical protein EVAR_7500_1 [Eumeta japonica]|uniref:Uncharacterized protein n=1 Tax=Eumeta variegata TaxID=151549 RepID=A0A4C1Y4E2_EUMVA|nr:hypothetical protein EVAR_7500_1 [Eumeta japonica]
MYKAAMPSSGGSRASGASPRRVDATNHLWRCKVEQTSHKGTPMFDNKQGPKSFRMYMKSLSIARERENASANNDSELIETRSETKSTTGNKLSRRRDVRTLRYVPAPCSGSEGAVVLYRSLCTSNV